MRRVMRIFCISVMIFFAVSFLGFKIYEKNKHDEELKLWEYEQEKYTKGDVVIYEQKNDKFGWRDNIRIEQVYKMGTGSYQISMENEKYESFMSVNFQEVFDSMPFSDDDIKQVSGKQWKVEELHGTELEFLCYREVYKGLSPEKYNYEGRTLDVYIWEDKCIVPQYKYSDKYDDIYGVNIYTIKTGERYHYPIGVMRNQPKDVLPGGELVLPKYYFCEDGRIFCIYKFYNKLYCHRLN